MVCGVDDARLRRRFWASIRRGVPDKEFESYSKVFDVIHGDFSPYDPPYRVADTYAHADGTYDGSYAGVYGP